MAAVLSAAATALSGTAVAFEAGDGAIQLVRIVGEGDEELRGELRGALRRALWRNGFPDARVSAAGAELPEFDPESRTALREWIVLGLERDADAIALVECRVDGDRVSLELWVIAVSSKTHHSAGLETTRGEAAEALVRLVAGAAEELVPSAAEVRAAEIDERELSYKAAKRRRNLGLGMLGLSVLFCVPTVVGSLMVTGSLNQKDPGTNSVASAPGYILIAVGAGATAAMLTAGVVFLISGVRRMDRYGLDEEDDAALRPRLAGLSPLLDRDGRPSGIGLRLLF